MTLTNRYCQALSRGEKTILQCPSSLESRESSQACLFQTAPPPPPPKVLHSGCGQSQTYPAETSRGWSSVKAKSPDEELRFYLSLERPTRPAHPRLRTHPVRGFPPTTAQLGADFIWPTEDSSGPNPPSVPDSRFHQKVKMNYQSLLTALKPTGLKISHLLNKLRVRPQQFGNSGLPFLPAMLPSEC